MAWFRIIETKYLCHCIKQLKKLVSYPNQRKMSILPYFFLLEIFLGGGQR